MNQDDINKIHAELRKRGTAKAGQYRPAYLSAADVQGLKVQLIAEFRNIASSFDKLIERIEAIEQQGK